MIVKGKKSIWSWEWRKHKSPPSNVYQRGDTGQSIKAQEIYSEYFQTYLIFVIFSPPVKKSEIPLHVEKFQISIHLSWGEKIGFWNLRASVWSKNLAQNSVHGEKMTNMRYAFNCFFLFQFEMVEYDSFSLND